MECAEAAEIMNMHGIDQLPVVDDVQGVVGVVTLGNLTSKILAKAVAPKDPVSACMFRQFRQVPLNTPLASLFHIFQRDAFCLVVANQKQLTSKHQVVEKKVVVGVCSQVNLLKYVVDGKPSEAPTAGFVVGRATQPSSAAVVASAPAAESRPDRSPSLDCAQMAWGFVAKKEKLTPPVSPQVGSTSPSVGSAKKSPLMMPKMSI